VVAVAVGDVDAREPPPFVSIQSASAGSAFSWLYDSSQPPKRVRTGMPSAYGLSRLILMLSAYCRPDQDPCPRQRRGIAAQLRANHRDPYQLPLQFLGLITPLVPKGNPAVT
jgi:hypothetical protein